MAIVSAADDIIQKLNHLQKKANLMFDHISTAGLYSDYSAEDLKKETGDLEALLVEIETQLKSTHLHALDESNLADAQTVNLQGSLQKIETDIKESLAFNERFVKNAKTAASRITFGANE